MGAPMRSAPTPLQKLAGAQASAASPDHHVWLSASAGTGKTHVLTARVFRLLLKGVAPENILCLTFTKAGAAEMADRIHDRLAAWVQMDDGTLFHDLEALGELGSPELCEKARRLFAQVLESTGGGLRIQTIHSFCQQLLAAFPLEAGLVPGFRALEDREQKALARQTLAELVQDADARGDEALMGAMQALSLRLGEAGAEGFLLRCAQRQGALATLPDDVEPVVRAALDLPEGDLDVWLADQCADGAFDLATLQWIARANADWGTARALPRCDAIAHWLALSPQARVGGLADLHRVWAKADGDPMSLAKGWAPPVEGYGDAVARMYDWCAALLGIRLRAGYAALLVQALYAGRAYADAYSTAKRLAGAVDFDDLIARAVALLKTGGMADWIRYKLDQRIDHILVDEAQDTNQRQWDIVEAIGAEFFAGEGAHGDMVRTLFTVGDFKQAIFGFQGTSPENFARAKDVFRTYAENAGQIFEDLSLARSFRSTPAVLEVVDETIAALTGQSLGLQEARVEHVSANRYPGEVMLWRPVVAGDGADAGGEENWAQDQERELAARIAKQIKEWLGSGLRLESRGRAASAGDVMILVRRRSELARLIVARLYEEGVPVAGIDRLRLNAPLAVQDLLAALRFAVQPLDDLNLAGLLVSPLIGWSQDELMHRAMGRRGALWPHLTQSADPQVIEPLRALLGQADFTTPYRYLEQILSGPMQGRRRLIERLGSAARDPIEELLNAALAFDSDERPSLQRFIDWFDRGDVEIVRDAAAQGDAVRLLTVHGAKGLQAPIVILADAALNPDAGRRSDMLEMRGIPVIPPRKAERGGPIDVIAAAAEQADREEHWRLLYVALTRAEEKLIVAGSLGPRAKGEVPPESWFAAVDRAMMGLGAEWEADARWEQSRFWRGRERLSPRPDERRKASVAEAVDLPPWLHSPAPAEARPPKPLAPSAPVEDDVPDPPPDAAMRRAAERGRWFHALFERLPAVDPAERRGAALAWLARQAGHVEPTERDAIVDQVLAVIDAPAFADIFGPSALAEAPVAAVVGEAVIAGTVDRLCIGDDLVQVIDFKTGRAVPAGPEQLPPSHVRQMAAYVAALEVVFPGRRVEAGLLYTAAPRLIMLPDALVAAHKPGLGGQQDNLSPMAVEPGVQAP
ncbi:double-strand break repair helicase AddA [Sphingobium fontiphilum]